MTQFINNNSIVKRRFQIGSRCSKNLRIFHWLKLATVKPNLRFVVCSRKKGKPFDPFTRATRDAIRLLCYRIAVVFVYVSSEINGPKIRVVHFWRLFVTALGLESYSGWDLNRTELQQNNNEVAFQWTIRFEVCVTVTAQLQITLITMLILYVSIS